MIFINILLLIGSIDAKEHPYNFWKPPVQQEHGNNKDNVKEDRRLSTFEDFNDDYNYNHVYQQPRDNSYNYNRNYDYEFYNDYPQTPLQKIADFLGYGNNKFKSGNPFQEIDRQITASNNLIFAAVVGSIAAAGVAAQTGLLDELNNFLNPTTTTTSAPTTTAFAIRTCIDGIQNGKETGVDCGGDCPACASGTVTTTIGIGTAKRRRRSLIASSRTFTTEDAFTEVKYAFRQVMASYFSFPFKDIEAKWKKATEIDVTFKIRDPSTISALETSINKAKTDQADLNKKMQAVDSLKTYKIDSVSEAAAKCDSADGCLGDSDTCDADGNCMCASNPKCSDSTDTCTKGECMCGENAKCSDTSDICTDGVCMCGEEPKCADDSDNCKDKTCKCGDNDKCAEPLSNICTEKVCKCGSETACTSGSTVGTCLAADASKPTSSDTAATCKCSGTGATDSCFVDTNTGYDKTKPLCGTSTVGTIGVCGGCVKTAGENGAGDGMSQGSCPTDGTVCCSDGSCQANLAACP